MLRSGGDACTKRVRTSVFVGGEECEIGGDGCVQYLSALIPGWCGIYPRSGRRRSRLSAATRRWTMRSGSIDDARASPHGHTADVDMVCNETDTLHTHTHTPPHIPTCRVLSSTPWNTQQTGAIQLHLHHCRPVSKHTAHHSSH